jgi:hypothetical protein
MATLQYDIRVVGMPAIKRATAGIERQISRLNRASHRAGGGVARRRGAGMGARGDAMSRARAVGASERAELASARRVSRERERAVQREQRARIRAINQAARAEQAAARKAMVTRQRTARRLAGRVTGAGRRAVGAVGAGAASMIGIAGSFAVAGAIQQQKRAQGAASELAARARGTEGSEGRTIGQLSRDVMKTARATSMVSGRSQEEVVAAMGGFQEKGGDLSAARAITPFMVDLSDAVGANLADIGTSAGIIFGGLRNQGLDTATALQKTKQILGDVAGQSKAGSIGMSDMARNMGALISSTANFEGDVADLASSMGAVAQVAVLGEAKSPEEAMTALSRFADDLVKNRKKFQAAGISTLTDKGELRDPMAVLREVMLKTKGNLADVQSLFGIRAKKAVSPFAKMMRDAGGGEAGVKAIFERIDFFKKQSLSENQARKDALERRKAADKQFEMAMAEFNAKVGEKLLPAFTKMIPSLTKLIPHATRAAEALAKFAEAAAKNPLATAGKVIMALMVADLGKAAIGATVTSALEKAILASMGGTGAGGAVARGASVMGGPGGGAGAGAGAGAAAARGGPAAGGGGLLAPMAALLGTGLGAKHQFEQVKRMTGSQGAGGAAAFLSSITDIGGLGALAGYGSKHAFDALGIKRMDSPRGSDGASGLGMFKMAAAFSGLGKMAAGGAKGLGTEAMSVLGMSTPEAAPTAATMGVSPGQVKAPGVAELDGKAKSAASALNELASVAPSLLSALTGAGAGANRGDGPMTPR